MWMLRKYYGGNGGALPPTDPRFLALTKEQIELDFLHILIDKEEKDGNAYQDDEYEEYDEETDKVDNKLSDMPAYGREASDPHAGLEKKLPKARKAEITDNDEWEEVEIDPSPAD